MEALLSDNLQFCLCATVFPIQNFQCMMPMLNEELLELMCIINSKSYVSVNSTFCLLTFIFIAYFVHWFTH